MLKFIIRLRDNINDRVTNFGNQYLAFGVFGVINYPLFYIIWLAYSSKAYENFTLRLAMMIISIPLIFHRHWPDKLKLWQGIYWYVTLMLCLPFFFTFMLLMNHESDVWLMSSNTVIFWLILLVDWLSYLYIIFFGISLAIIFFVIKDPNFSFNFSYWWGILSQIIASLIVIAFFAGNKEKFNNEKFKTMEAISASIAHELRTPLSTVALNTETIDESLPILIKNNAMLANQDVTEKTLSPRKINYLQQALSSIKNEVKASLLFIEMLLINLRPAKFSTQFETYSVKEIVQEAIERYPFQNHQKDKIQLDLAADFKIKGEKVFLIHLFFNLIKNALYAIAAVSHDAGVIQIKTSSNGQHVLSFKDTGIGISKSALKHIFDKFYSDKRHGSGIGLAYCKMIMSQLGGKMKVRSKLGEFTEFYLIFPQLKDV